MKLGHGLLVEDVRALAARVDLRPGDVILSLVNKGNVTDLKTVEQFNKLLGQFEKGASVTLLIRRGELQTFIILKGFNGN